MPKFPSKEKVINTKVKVIILWILKRHLLEMEGALLHSLPKSGAMAPPAPGSYVLEYNTGILFDMYLRSLTERSKGFEKIAESVNSRRIQCRNGESEPGGEDETFR